MLCESPYVKDGQAFGCSRCLPCLINRRRIWATRIMLEAMSYSDNAYVTLTYDEDAFSKSSSGELTLSPLEAQNWLKRLRVYYERYQRKLHTELRINEPFEEWQRFFRFYLVGEYGEKNGRPHYHAILFNFPTCAYGRTKRKRLLVNGRPSSEPDWSDCCVACRMVGTTWGKGLVDLGRVERGSAEYVCQYVTKKMTGVDDVRLKPGQHPEFARMSRMPGIGQPSLWEYASALMGENIPDLPDVPGGVRVGPAEKGMGVYLRRQLRMLMGQQQGAPEHTKMEAQERLRPLREAAFNASKSFKETIVEAHEGKRRSTLARRKIFDGRKKL